MTASFNQEIVDEIKSRLDIVEIIGAYVQLKKRGRNYVGLCPFHSEKTPSFTVSPEKQMFYCFGCGTGGDIIAFIMKQNSISFPEAVSALATRAGVELVDDKETPVDRRQRELKQRLYQLGAVAASFYYRILAQHPAGAGARDYLKKRGLRGTTAKLFELGYAPDRARILVSYLRKKGFALQEIDQAGLSVYRSTTGTMDRFRGRIMFPIKDRRGRVIGFGGRILGEGQPKYLNTPETVLFKKGKNLYGLHLALEGIRKKRQAILVEGYMDMITAWQHGIDNVVATLGTSLTREQAHELKKYAEEVIIAYDADTAGTGATLRGLEVLTEAGLRVKILQLPEGKDPDEFLSTHGPQAFNELIKKSFGLMEFRINKAVSNHDVNTAQGKKDAVAEVLPYLRKLDDAVEQEAYARVLSRYTGISETAILNSIYQRNGIQDKVEKTRYTRSKHVLEDSMYSSGELFLVLAYINSVHLAENIDEKLGHDWGESPATKSLVEAARKERKRMPGLEGMELIRVINDYDEKGVGALLARLNLTEGLGPLEERAVNKAIRVYKLHRLKKQEKELCTDLARAEADGTVEQVQKLQTQIYNLQQTIKLLKLEGGSYSDG